MPILPEKIFFGIVIVFSRYCGGGHSSMVEHRVVVPTIRVQFPLATPEYRESKNLSFWVVSREERFWFGAIQAGDGGVWITCV